MMKLSKGYKRGPFNHPKHRPGDPRIEHKQRKDHGHQRVEVENQHENKPIWEP